ncbi:MAG: hypothetical protein ABIK65_07020 [Candidatus Eisenbacteria bacterium]
MSTRDPLYEESHLYVAGVRVLAHTHHRPPTVEEVADLIDLSKEAAYHLARALAGKHILRMIENPFETHLEIADHRALESLPREETGPGIAEDLEEFTEKKKKEHDKLGDFFKTGGMEKTKEKKLSKIEEEFKKFRRRVEEED